METSTQKNDPIHRGLHYAFKLVAECAYQYITEPDIVCDFKESHKLERAELEKRINSLIKTMPNRFQGEWKGDVFYGRILFKFLGYEFNIPIEFINLGKHLAVRIKLNVIQEPFRDKIENRLKTLIKEILR